LPQTDENQTITELSVEGPVPSIETTERTYGNRAAFFNLKNPKVRDVEIRIQFRVNRREAHSLHERYPVATRARFLQPDRLVRLDGEVATRAREAIEGQDERIARVRAIYNRVLADVDYDKSGMGWGRGDTDYVCEVGKGNCSDFHSLFIGMARAAGIPSIFEIGFPLPADDTHGTLGGYHCWAWFEVENGRWIPVDASEADKHPELTDYYFGTLCANRVAFTRGRDIVLEPAQLGPPLNFWIEPYVEVDGRPGVVTVTKDVRFEG
jgi:transglutaminase-like putative cysteine protease